jgi:hypothetical protein
MHVRIVRGSYNRIEGNRFQGGTSGEGGGRAIQIDSGASVYWPEGTVLRDNTIDLTGGIGDGGAVLLALETRNSVVSGNTLINALLELKGTVVAS